MDISKTESKQETRLINKLILAITFEEYSLNLDDYDKVVPKFVKMYHELATIHHKTITDENYKTSIMDFVQDLSLSELQKWAKLI